MNAKQIGGIVFRQNNAGINFLLLKRTPKKGGFWQAITGEVENETLLEAVFREAREETGIEKKDITRVIENVNSFEYKNLKKHCMIKEYVFGLEIKSNFKITLDKNIYKEHDEFRWVPFKEAISLLRWESSKTSLQNLNQILENENSF